MSKGNLRLQLKGLSTCDSLKQAENDRSHEGFMGIISKILLGIFAWNFWKPKSKCNLHEDEQKGCIPRNIRQRVRQGRGSGWSWIFKGGTSTFVWMSTPIRPPPFLRLSEGSPQNLAAIDKFFRIPLSLKPLKSSDRSPWQICWIENSFFLPEPDPWDPWDNVTVSVSSPGNSYHQLLSLEEGGRKDGLRQKSMTAEITQHSASEYRASQPRAEITQYLNPQQCSSRRKEFWSTRRILKGHR